MRNHPVHTDIPSDAVTIEVIERRVGAAAGLVLLLDYDGTLVDLADRPELAVPDADLRSLLESLAARAATAVHLVSGRPRETLHAWFGDAGLWLWAEHGAFLRARGEEQWRPQRAIPDGWAAEPLRVLERACAMTPGAFVEHKAAGLAWHYRLSPSPLGEQQARAVTAALAPLTGITTGLELLHGSNVVEVRLRGVSKALAADYVRTNQPSHLVLAAGDDTTDDDMFRALSPADLTLAVGDRPSAARLRLSSPAALRRLLGRLCA